MTYLKIVLGGGVGAPAAASGRGPKDPGARWASRA